MKTNKRKEDFNRKRQKEEAPVGTIGRAAQDVLGGAILENKKTQRIIPYLLFLAFLAFVYITNDYLLENKVRTITRLQREIKELRYEYVSVKSNLMTLSKQSQLEKRLESLGIKENMEPVKTIVIHTKQGK